MLFVIIAIWTFWLPLVLGGHWIISVAIVVICGILSLLPFEGYKDRVCEEEIELLPLKWSNEKEYVYVIGKRATFAYDNSEQYEIDGVAYQEKSIKGNIIVYESKTCEQPVLKVFKIEPSRNFIAFAPFSTKYEYVFFVPETKRMVKSDKPNIIV